MASGQQYPGELAYIREQRAANPSVPAKKFAKAMESHEGAGPRSFYSIYSVIRRYDASKKAVATSTVKGKKNKQATGAAV